MKLPGGPWPLTPGGGPLPIDIGAGADQPCPWFWSGLNPPAPPPRGAPIRGAPIRGGAPPPSIFFYLLKYKQLQKSHFHFRLFLQYSHSFLIEIQIGNGYQSGNAKFCSSFKKYQRQLTERDAEELRPRELRDRWRRDRRPRDRDRERDLDFERDFFSSARVIFISRPFNSYPLYFFSASFISSRFSKQTSPRFRPYKFTSGLRKVNSPVFDLHLCRSPRQLFGRGLSNRPS